MNYRSKETLRPCGEVHTHFTDEETEPQRCLNYEGNENWPWKALFRSETVSSMSWKCTQQVCISMRRKAQ
jgi:hypothetical protein